MRRGILIFVAVLVVTGLVSHLLVIRALPTIIMNRGTAVIADLGVVPNQWFIAPQITAENSAVVRASPDLAYAVCLLDLTEGPCRFRPLAAQTMARFRSLMMTPPMSSFARSTKTSKSTFSFTGKVRRLSCHPARPPWLCRRQGVSP